MRKFAALEPQNEDMTFAVFDFFFDIEDERAAALQGAKKLGGTGDEPLDVEVRFDAAVGMCSAIGVRRRCHDQIKSLIVKIAECSEAVALAYIGVWSFHARVLHGAGALSNARRLFCLKAGS